MCRLYGEFVLAFKINITEMCICPKIIVFTSNKNRFLEYNKNYGKNDDKFYSFGGIGIIFEQVKEFLINDKKHKINNYLFKKQTKTNDIQLYFDKIDCKEKLSLPLFFKSLIDNTTNDNMEKYINELYNEYSKKSDELKQLLEQIDSIPNIPIEILSKYYSRLFTAASCFHSDINKDL